MTPSVADDFSVPTPIDVDGHLLVITENNGTRLYNFHEDGTIIADPAAVNYTLRPNMSSAVIANNYLYCVDRFLYCLDLQNDLKQCWRLRDRSLSAYASIVASDQHMMVVGDGELLFLACDGERTIRFRQKFDSEKLPVYSHPAIADGRLYIRTESSIYCFALGV